MSFNCRKNKGNYYKVVWNKSGIYKYIGVYFIRSYKMVCDIDGLYL